MSKTLTIQEFIASFESTDHYGRRVSKPRIFCKDGWSISIQADEYMAATKEGDEWITVELGFPSRFDKLIKPYAEPKLDRTDTYTNSVYNHVPIEVVEKLVVKHGGIVGTILRGCEREVWKRK